MTKDYIKVQTQQMGHETESNLQIKRAVECSQVIKVACSNLSDKKSELRCTIKYMQVMRIKYNPSGGTWTLEPFSW